MIEKWEIKDISQNKKALLIRCDFKDILSIIKKVGPVLSRPERLLKGDYTFIIYFLENGIESKIEKAIEEIIGKTTKETKKITSKVPEEESQKLNEKVSLEDNVNIEIPMPELEVKLDVKIERETKKEESSRIIPIKGPVTPKTFLKKSSKEKENLEKESAGDKEKNEVPPPPNISQRSLNRLKLRWSIELPLNPMMSFQTLITGSHNRFAHAASMAVVENPGVMYNPILIWGPMGSGKSHFIHSMSYGLSATMGQKNIFVTNGIKFSVGVTIAIKEGFLDSISQLIENSKVVIVDDIHLMLINKENKDFISKVIYNCMQSNKQVVFSSLFSPKELEPLEKMLGIELSQGWMVDIKQPNPQSYRAVLNQIIGNMDVKLSEEHIKKFFVSKSLDFRTATVMLVRMKKFEKYISSINPSFLHQDLLDMLFGEKDDLSHPSLQEVKEVNFYPSSTPDSFYKWGIFYPKEMKDYLRYVYFKMSQVSSNIIGTDLSWYNVFEEEYDPDEVYGIPFKIGSYVLEKNVNGVIVIGPPPTSALSTKEIEFRHLVDKILESLNIKVGWIYSNKLKATSNYLNAVLDLI